MNPWQKYQQDAASYFRSLGLDASVDVSMRGVRTNHDIDVLVKSNYVGFEITWIVECKHWKSAVSKLHVLALRGIVAELGADRGILLSEEGFQSGAREAANLTNVQVTSIAEMRATASGSVHAMRLRDLYDRVELCRERYWDIPKDERIVFGLRPELFEHDYSGAQTIELSTELLTRAFRGVYPFQIDTLLAMHVFGRDKKFRSPTEVVNLAERMVSELEKKLDARDR